MEAIITTELNYESNDQKKENDTRPNLQCFPEGHIPIDTPAQGDCLFWSVMLCVLITFKDTEHFSTMVSRLFGEQEHNDRKSRLNDSLLPSYKGHVDNLDNSQARNDFYDLMMIFRRRVVNHIRSNEEFHQYIDEELESYFNKMSKPGSWGGQIEIRAMAALLETDIVVYSKADPLRMSARENASTPAVIAIAHVSCGSEINVGNHYHYLISKSVAQKCGFEVDEEKQQQHSQALAQPTTRHLFDAKVSQSEQERKENSPSSENMDYKDNTVLSSLLAGMNEDQKESFRD